MVNCLKKGFIESFEVKDIDKKSGLLTQAYTRYNVVDSDEDRGRKGMFTKTWKENFSRIRHLLNHNVDKAVGNPVKFWEDDEYAYYQSQIGTHDLGRDFAEMVDSNLIKEASYGYTVIKSNKLKDGTNELLEVKLWEVSSLTGWGANQYTPITSFTKSMDKAAFIKTHLEKYAALDRFLYTSKATDATLQELEIEKKNMEQQLIQLFSTPAEEQSSSLEPEVKDAGLLLLSTTIEQQKLKLQNLQTWN